MRRTPPSVPAIRLPRLDRCLPRSRQQGCAHAPVHPGRLLTCSCQCPRCQCQTASPPPKPRRCTGPKSVGVGLIIDCIFSQIQVAIPFHHRRLAPTQLPRRCSISWSDCTISFSWTYPLQIGPKTARQSRHHLCCIHRCSVCLAPAAFLETFKGQGTAGKRGGPSPGSICLLFHL